MTQTKKSLLLSLVFSLFFSANCFAMGAKSIEEICPLPKADETPAPVLHYENTLRTDRDCQQDDTKCMQKYLAWAKDELCNKTFKSLSKESSFIEGTFQCFDNGVQSTGQGYYSTDNCSADGEDFRRSTLSSSCLFRGSVRYTWKARNVVNKSALQMQVMDKKIAAISQCKKSAVIGSDDDLLLRLEEMNKIYLRQKEQLASELAASSNNANEADQRSTPVQFAGKIEDINSDSCDLKVDARKKVMLYTKKAYAKKTYKRTRDDYDQRYFESETKQLCATLRNEVEKNPAAIQETFFCREGEEVANETDSDSIDPLWIFGPRIYFETNRMWPIAEAQWKAVREALTGKQILEEKLEKLQTCISKEKNDLKLLMMDDLRSSMRALYKTLP